MTSIDYAVDVDAPLHTTFRYFCWFEAYPEFMKSVERVRRDDNEPDTLHWILTLASVLRETTVTVERGDDLVRWRSVDGMRHRGEARFESKPDGRCRVSVRIEFAPVGFVERTGHGLGFARNRVRGDLRRFARYVESRGEHAPAGKRAPGTPYDDRRRSYAEKLTERAFGPPEETG